jgi:anti-anti-sigma factor
MQTSSYDSANHVLTFVFSGSMDTAQSAADAGAVTAALDKAQADAAGKPELLSKPLRAIFDLQAVDYVSSAFFRICLTTAKQARKGNFTVANARPAVTQLMKIAGMDEFLAAL